MKRLVQNITVALAAVVVGLWIVEGSLRLWAPQAIYVIIRYCSSGGARP